MEILLFLLILGVLSLVLVWVNGLPVFPPEGQGTPRQNLNNENSNSEGGRPVLDDKTYEGLDTIVDVVNQAMEDVGLPKVDIESARSIFGRMPPKLREQMDAHLGPNFKDAVTGFLNMHLEMIGKAEEFQARAALMQIQEALQVYQTDVAGRFAVRRVEKMLAHVHGIADVADEYGVESMEEYRRLVGCAVVKSTTRQLFSSVEGVDAREVDQAVDEAFLLEAQRQLPSQEAELRTEDEDVPLDGVYEEIDTRSNGH